MSARDFQPDVLIVGTHPCSYLAAALLRSGQPVSVMHVGHEVRDDGRLTLLNPAFFTLDAMLKPLESEMNLSPIHGLKFLSDDSGTFCEHIGATPMAYVCNCAELTRALRQLAHSKGVHFADDAELVIHHLDERGASVSVDGVNLHPAALILSDVPDEDQQRILKLADEWNENAFFRLTSVSVPATRGEEKNPLLRMSLDVGGSLAWAWLLRHGHNARAIVAQPLSSLSRYAPAKLLRHWTEILKAHDDLPKDFQLVDSEIQSTDLPLGGALSQEGIGNRTLLIGPAGGFYSECGEDLYPNCWSAVFAAEVIRSALREKHLQDSLNQYRTIWRTTLGDYLRGPQQNLRFLLPLIYRNQTMAGRLAEAILLGKSVVR